MAARVALLLCSSRRRSRHRRLSMRSPAPSCSDARWWPTGRWRRASALMMRVRAARGAALSLVRLRPCCLRAVSLRTLARYDKMQSGEASGSDEDDDDDGADDNNNNDDADG